MNLKHILYSAIGILSIFPLYFFFWQQTPHETQLKHLRLNLSEGDPPSLHPHLASDIRGRILGKALFEGLTRLNKQGKGEPAACEAIELDPSSTVYTFSLRPHSWSNGEQVTAYQFEKAWQQAVDPNSNCARADLFYIVKNAKKIKKGELPVTALGIHALDEKTLRVELENPAPYFLELISHPVFSPVYDQEIEPKAFNGPFELNEWKRGSVLGLRKNPLYWDKQAVDLDKISIFMVSTLNVEQAMFQRDELDIIGDCFDSFPVDFLPEAMQSPHFRSQEISRVYWLYVNTQQPPFTSDKIRKAFAYALNRSFLAKNFLIGDTPCFTILPKTLTTIKNDSVIDEDKEKALELFQQGLEELSLTKESFPQITLSYCNYGSQKSLSELLQEKLQKTLGIRVVLQSLEWNTLVQNFIHGQFQLASCMRNAIYEDPLYFLEIFKEKNNSYNYSRWENESYKQLLNTAIATSEKTKRDECFYKAEKLLQDEMPVIPIYTENCKYLVKDNLKGYFINNSGYVDLKYISFDQ